MPIPAYVSHGLDDGLFQISQSALQNYKDLFSDHGSLSSEGLSILQGAPYAPDNFQSLGLVAFFSKGQIETLLGITPNVNLRPDTVGLIVVLGLEDSGDLRLIIGPSDEVGRIIPSQNSFDKSVVKKWGVVGSNVSETVIDMENYQGMRGSFMQVVSGSNLRYKGFIKLQSLASGEVKFNVDGKSLFFTIFDIDIQSASNLVNPPITTTFQVTIRNDDTHPLLADNPARYLTIAAFRNNPFVAYSGRATPTYTVYNNHPR